MIRVDLDELERLLRETAGSLNKRVELRHEATEAAKTLHVKSGVNGTAEVMLTTVEDGTLFWELRTGEHTDWLIRDEQDLATMHEEIRLMFEAILTGSISPRGVLTARGRRFRLAGPPSPLSLLRRLTRHYSPYPDRQQRHSA